MNAHGHGASRRLRHTVAATVFALLGVGLTGVSAAAPALADTDPAVGTPATVSADSLPTWQINGVVWSQVTVGNTVYATGSFTKARPPGVAAGGTGEVTANNIFAYDIRTGNRVATFSHDLNAQGMVVTASPDGSRVYVGGDFTTVDGVARGHIAAFDTATGALVASFAPSINGQVRAMAVNGGTVYAGGGFQSANGQVRTRLAAFSTSNGAMLSWAPQASDGAVWSMVVAPDRSKVILGGQFTTLSGTSVYGMGAVDPVSGQVLPWAANDTIRDSNKGAITSLRTDGTQIYGSGFAFGTGASFEGPFALDPATGAINWLNDCHGDTYDVMPVGKVLYTVSHAHNCSMIGAFPQTDPWSVNMRHALAFTTYPTGKNVGPDDYGWNYNGMPASSMLQWYPELYTGSYTGQGQAAWSITGNSDYLALGGEFPGVNKGAQQGLARFAVRGLATNKRGPVSAPAAPAPSAIAVGAGQVRVGWQAAYDMDNTTLTYKVYRSGTTAPVATFVQDSNYWTYPSMGFRDVGLTPGGTFKYTIKVTDPLGNLLTLPVTNSITVATTPPSAYAKDVAADGASHYWRLGEPSGSAVYDYAGFDDMAANAAVTRGAAGAIAADTDAASSFDGSTAFAATQSPVIGPDVFTEEAWFRTTSTTGGKIVSFGNQKTGESNNYDRHIYMDPAGQVWFGVYNNGSYTVNTSKALNDGQWHHAVGTMDSSGVTLYVDGKRVGHNGGTASGQPYSGYWRIGGDSAWNGNPYFNGDIDDVAIYPTALTSAQVQAHYTDSGRTVDLPPKPTDSYGKAVYSNNPDLYWRLGESAGNTAKDATQNEFNGVYSGGVTYGVDGAVTGTSDKAVTFNGSDGAVASASTVTNPTVYSEELWFNTTTHQGGKLIGFGSGQFGGSGGYDRHVYMVDSGQLVFGVWTGQPNTVVSPLGYNDGTWHHMVATQGSDGMKLFVDGVLVGTNPQTQAQDYTGYWRVGGDTTWGGNSSNYFAGSIDEVAVYSTALSPADVVSHFKAGGGSVPNQAPTAAFTSSASGLNASFDGSGSTDADGTLASYAWDFGDASAAGTGPTPARTYGAAGTYTVTLTVTDDKGATNVKTDTVTVTNSAPTAAFTSSATALAASFDGTGSSDTDGTIASYAWTFGDGATSTDASPSHTYAAGGSYNVTLTVTDNARGTATVTHSLTVAKANVLPTAAFTSTASGLAVAFDGSASADSDGTLASYAWDFGDGSTGTGVSPSHTYVAGGSYTVKLTVTDNRSGTDSATHAVTVTAPNKAPTAAFTSSAAALVASFDATASSDADGSIASYAWDFGDGATGTGVSPSHTFVAGGSYTVKLTVTDNRNGTDSATHAVTVTAPNKAPTAAFTSASSGLVASFDASGSSDADGSIASYAWDFGDGATGTGVKPSHTYAAAGTFDVSLTVVDGAGASGQVDHGVVVATISSALAEDAFTRTVTGGWGKADVGGVWSLTGTASRYSVANGAGSMLMTAPGQGPGAFLGAVASTDTDLRADASVDKAPSGGGTYFYLVGRRVNATNDYRAKVKVASNGVVTVSLTKTVAGVETALVTKTVSGVTLGAGDVLQMRLQVTGKSTTTMRFKAWAKGAAEPADWLATGTDATAPLQVPGGVGLFAYLSGTSTNAPVMASFDNVLVKLPE